MIKTQKTVSILFAVMLLGMPPVASTDGAEQSSAESIASAVHSRFEPPFPAWFPEGGDATRYVFLNFAEFFRQSVLNRTGPVKPLPEGDFEAVADLDVVVDGNETTVADYVARSQTDAAIVLHEGRIVFEAYPRMEPDDLHIWFSVSKTFVSTAVAILEDRGLIDARHPIDDYIPSLRDTAWEGTPIVDLLDMASGIDCPEIHDDLDTCFWRFYDGLGWPMADRAVEDPWKALEAMARLRPTGEVFDYTSVNTEALAWLVTKVSGERFADFVEREIWQKTGAARNALITSTPGGQAFSAGGVSTTLRDLARYGLLFTPAGRSSPDPAISDAYLEKIQRGGRPHLAGEAARQNTMLGDGSFRHNAWQWDLVTTDGDFFKGGAGGQGLYISPGRNLVIAWFGTHDEDGKGTRMLRVARQIATSGLFGDPGEKD